MFDKLTKYAKKTLGINELEKRIDKIEHEIVNLNSRIVDRHLEIRRLKENNNEINIKIAKLNQIVEHETVDLQSKILNLYLEIKKLKENNTELNIKIAKLNQLDQSPNTLYPYPNPNEWKVTYNI